MIPILYNTSETSFTTNGIGRLTDAISCVVTEEKNTNNYILQMEYPVSGQYFNELTIDKIIYATHDTSEIPQAFDIYNVSEPHGTISKTITVYAKHISRRLSTVVACAGGTISDGPAAYLDMLNYTAADGGLIFGDCPFTFYSDIPDSAYPSPGDTDFWKAGYLTSKNQPVETILLDTGMGLLSERQYPGPTGDTIDEGFGDVGEYLFDMFSVSLLQHRGVDNGVKFRTGKNVRQLTVETDNTDVVCGVIPFWQGKNPISGETQYVDLYTSYEPSDDDLSETEANVNYDKAIIYGPTQYPYQKTRLLDLSSVWKQPPTYAELYQAGYEWLQRHAYNVLSNYKTYLIDLVAMSDNTSSLQAANLCDYVTVQDEVLGESMKVQIVKVTYDTLHDRYVSMEVGAARKTLPELVKKQNAIWIEKVQQTATEVSDLAEKTVVENIVKPDTGSSPSSSGSYSSSSSSSDDTMYDEDGQEVEQIATINRQPVYAHVGGGGGGGGGSFAPTTLANTTGKYIYYPDLSITDFDVNFDLKVRGGIERMKADNVYVDTKTLSLLDPSIRTTTYTISSVPFPCTATFTIPRWTASLATISIKGILHCSVIVPAVASGQTQPAIVNLRPSHFEGIGWLKDLDDGAEGVLAMWSGYIENPISFNVSFLAPISS